MRANDFRLAPLQTLPRTLFHSLHDLDRTHPGTRPGPVHLICRAWRMLKHSTTSHLSSCIPVLPAFCETFVQIRADDTFVQLGAPYILHAVQSVLVCVVFHKTKTARSFLESI